MNIKFLNTAWLSLKNTALRFPAFFVGTLIAAFSATISRSSISFLFKIEKWKWICLSSLWVCAASFFAEILCRTLFLYKKISESKERILHFAFQLFSLLLFLPVYFILYSQGDFSFCIYACTFFILLALGFYLLHNFQDEKYVVPNATVSLIIEGITVTCLVLGLYLVIFAFHELVFHFKSFVPYTACFYFASSVIGLNLLVSYVTRPSKAICAPKAFNVILSCALLPIYVMLVAVLYIYFAKCLFTLTLPVGKINPFVSAASAVYLYFYLSLPREGNFSFAASLFRKYGSLFLLPLIALQCFSFAVRIRAYGFTVSRVLSLYYILCSIIFCILPLIKGGRYMKSVYLLLSSAALFATLPFFSCISIAKQSQEKRIIRIYENHFLYKDGKLKIQEASSLLSDKEKAAVVSAADVLYTFKKKPSWWPNTPFYDFEKTFGFEYSSNYAALDIEENLPLFNALSFRAAEGFALDVKDYSVLYRFSESSWEESDDVKGEISFADGKRLDFSQELRDYLLSNSTAAANSEPYQHPMPDTDTLTLKKDGWTVIFTCLDLSMKEGSPLFREFIAEGYVCR